MIIIKVKIILLTFIISLFSFITVFAVTPTPPPEYIYSVRTSEGIYIYTTQKAYINNTGTELFQPDGSMACFYNSDGSTILLNSAGSSLTSKAGGLTFTQANYDILRADSSVFFSPPSPLATADLLSPTLSQVLGLVPLLIGLVVGFLALRKGLQMLSTILRQA